MQAKILCPLPPFRPHRQPHFAAAAEESAWRHRREWSTVARCCALPPRTPVALSAGVRERAVCATGPGSGCACLVRAALCPPFRALTRRPRPLRSTVFKAGGMGAPPVIAAAPAPGADAPWGGGSSDRYGQGVRNFAPAYRRGYRSARHSPLAAVCPPSRLKSQPLSRRCACRRRGQGLGTAPEMPPVQGSDPVQVRGRRCARRERGEKERASQPASAHAAADCQG